MSVATGKWSDNESVTATYTGSGDSTVVISTGVNEGLDRNVLIKITTSDNSINKSITLTQLGKREIFYAKNGESFILSGGDTLNVLKS